MLREADERRWLGVVLMVEAEALLCLGSIQAAREHFEEGLGLARAVGDRRTQAVALRAQAKMARYIGRGRGASAPLIEAIELCREIGDTAELGRCWVELGHLRLSQGRFATEALDALRPIMEALGETPRTSLHVDVEELEESEELLRAGRPLLAGRAPHLVPSGLARAAESVGTSRDSASSDVSTP